MASWFSGLATFSVGLISLFQAFYKPKPKIEVKIASVEGNSINISYKAVYKAIISIQNKSVVNILT
jgi:ribosomal protein L10